MEDEAASDGADMAVLGLRLAVGDDGFPVGGSVGRLAFRALVSSTWVSLLSLFGLRRDFSKPNRLRRLVLEP